MIEVHSFETRIACEYGVNAAILLHDIRYWVEHNRVNGQNFHDGRYWTYNSAKAFKKMYPYMTESAIRTALKRLEEDGIIATGNYNATPYDRTKWYTLTDKGEALFDQASAPRAENVDDSICENPKMEKEEAEDQYQMHYQIDNPIKEREVREAPKRFSPPTIDEVRKYCQERKNKVSPERFVAYYESNGWKVGRNPMKDWKAAVRNWESRDREQTFNPNDDSKYDFSSCYDDWEA